MDIQSFDVNAARDPFTLGNCQKAKSLFSGLTYSGTLIIGPLLGWSKTGQIGKVVTLSRWPEWMLSLTAGQLYKKSQTGWSKSGPISKVVRLSGWSHSKVPLYRAR